MKILFIASGILGDRPGISGSESRFIEIAKHWANKGHEIHLLSSQGGKYVCEQFGLSVVLHEMPKVPYQNRIGHVIRLFQSVFVLPDSLAREKFDLICSSSEGSYDVIPAWHLKRQMTEARWIVIVHWLPPFPPWKRTGSSVLNSTAFFITERLGLRLALKGANHLLTVSESTAQQLKEINVPSTRYTAVECGVEFERIQSVVSQVKTKQVDAVFMKRLQTVKGVFDLIEIWKKVVEQIPNAKLWVIGEGLEGERMKQVARDQGLEKNIEFLGVIYDFQEKYRRLAQAKLFLLPSHEENWAIVIGEALAAGIPVISYDLPELKSVWKEGCIFVPKHDVDAFAKRVLELLRNAEDRAKQEQVGLHYVKAYDWKAIAEKEWQIIFSDQAKSPNKS
jgi:glycosyltransferase involved in cell wall biosynthesis